MPTMIIEKRVTTYPVSYTHLDVYKRQVSVTVKSCPQFQFDAGVFHLSHVVFVGGESGRGRDGIIGYQVDGTLVVGRGFQICLLYTSRCV